MSDEYGVQGLNGTEIIADILAQFKKQLEGDCNLRPYDSYSRGYSAKITYHVACYGLDQTLVEGEFDGGTEEGDPEAEVVDGKLEVEQEEDLGEVRDRIANSSDTSQDPDDNAPEPTTAAGIKARRKYTRKVQLVSPGVIGGTEKFKE